MTATGVLTRDELLRVDRDGHSMIALVLCKAIREHQVALLSPRLEEISDLCQGRLGLCLSEVHGMSCGFLEAMVRLSRRAEAAGGQLVVFQLSTEVRSLLRSTGLDTTLTLALDREEALAILNLGEPGHPGREDRVATPRAALSLRRLFGRAA